MKAIIEGTLLEKAVIDKVYDGKPVHKKVFILYQRGERNTPQVTVSEETFNKYDEGDHVMITVRVNPYYFNNRLGMSLVEQG